SIRNGVRYAVRACTVSTSDIPIPSSVILSALYTLFSTIIGQGIIAPLGRGRKHRTLYKLSLLVILSLFLSLFNFTPSLSARSASNANASAGTTGTQTSSSGAATAPRDFTYAPPTPEVRTAIPVVDPHLPSLSVSAEVSPRIVSVGDTFTVTL